MNFFYRYLRSKTIHSCKSYTKSFFSTLFVVFCFEITFKIVKMRSISAVDFFSYEFVNGAILINALDLPTVEFVNRFETNLTYLNLT